MVNGCQENFILKHSLHTSKCRCLRRLTSMSKQSDSLPAGVIRTINQFLKVIYCQSSFQMVLRAFLWWNGINNYGT